jgi:hypothetical protein
MTAKDVLEHARAKLGRIRLGIGPTQSRPG